MSGAVPLLPLYAFVVWVQATLPIFLLHSLLFKKWQLLVACGASAEAVTRLTEQTMTDGHDTSPPLIIFMVWCLITEKNCTSLCEIWGSHNTVAKDACLLGHYFVFLVRRFLMMENILTPSRWGSGWRSYDPLEHLGIVITSGLSLHHRRPESSALHCFVLLPHTVQQACSMKIGSGQCMGRSHHHW
jgi:hypothetical protein